MLLLCEELYDELGASVESTTSRRFREGYLDIERGERNGPTEN